jgi:hypothetical protein
MRDAFYRLATTQQPAVIVARSLPIYAGCIYLAFSIRCLFNIPDVVTQSFWLTISAVVAIKIIISVLTGEWKLSLRSACAREMHTMFLSATLSAVVIFFANLTLFAALGSAIPRSVIAIDWALTIGVASLLRLIFSETPGEERRQASWIPLSAGLAGMFLLSMGLVYCSLTHDLGLTEWFNGDALYLGHLVQDVFVDGNSFDGWMFPPAPFIFPDLFCAMLGRLLTGHAALGMFLTGAIIYSLVVLAAVYAAAICTRERRTTAVLMTIAAVIVAAGIAWGGSRTDLRFLLLPAYHTGTYALAIFLAALGVQIAVDDGSQRPYLIGLFAAVGFCAGFSDLFTIAFVSAPLTVALAAGWIVNVISARRSALVGSLIWVMPMAGVYCCREVMRMMEFGNFSKLSIASISKAAGLIVDGYLTELVRLRPLALLSFLWILGSWMWALAWLYHRARSTSFAENLTETARRKFLLVICFSLGGMASFGALMAGGNYTLLYDGYSYIVRYLHPLYYTPLLFWPLLIPDPWLTKIGSVFPPRIAVEFAAAALLMLAAGIGIVGVGPYPLHTYVPDYVQKLEQITAERGIRHGVAYYWTARHVNMFAKGGLKIFPINPQMVYFDWMNNRNWVMGPFDNSSLAPRPEFVVVSPTEAYQKGDILKHFGEPAEDIPLDEAGTRSVLIYNREQDVALRELFVRPAALWLTGFYPLENDGAREWRWCEANGALVMHNPTSEVMQVAVAFDCATAFPERSKISMVGPLFSREVSVNHLGTTIEETVAIPPGSHAVMFSTDSNPLIVPTDSRKLYFQVRNFQMSLVDSSDKIGSGNVTRVATKPAK